MKLLILTLSLFASLSTQAAVFNYTEALSCRYQLRNDGYSQAMPFTLEVKTTIENGVRQLEVSLSSGNRFFSALNIQVKSTIGWQVQPDHKMRLQSTDPMMNSKAEILNRTIKLEVRDLDGKDWRSISCLHSNLNGIVESSMQAFRNE
jgi:hypothetical protein